MNEPENNGGKRPFDEKHHFPTLKRSAAIQRESEESSICFKPMFTCKPGNYSPTSPSRSNKENPIEQQEHEKVCECGYQSGFEAGKQDACRLANESIEPQLVDFLQAYENVSAFHQHLTQTASSHVVQMALSICKQILKAPVDMPENKLDAIQDAVQATMIHTHRLNLCFNVEDLEALQELTACFNLSWPSSEAVYFSTTDMRHKGKPTIKKNAEAKKNAEQLLRDRLPDLLK